MEQDRAQRKGQPAAARRPGATGAVWAIAAVSVLIELLLSLADRGILLDPSTRLRVFSLFAFWPARWSAEGGFALQWLVTAVTYAFLHGNFIHLAVNMFSLSWIGMLVARRAGAAAFVITYFATSIAGAAAFWLLSAGTQPMVGASGALFGLVGCLIGWEAWSKRRRGATLRPIAEAILVLVLLNLVLFFAVAGQLAWQAHAGGFAAGFAAAPLLARRARRG